MSITRQSGVKSNASELNVGCKAGAAARRPASQRVHDDASQLRARQHVLLETREHLLLEIFTE